MRPFALLHALTTLFSAFPPSMTTVEDPSKVNDFGFDPTRIRWFLPGDFAGALECALDTHRILLIKGVSFNIDEIGARCATQGTW